VAAGSASGTWARSQRCIDPFARTSERVWGLRREVGEASSEPRSKRSWSRFSLARSKPRCNVPSARRRTLAIGADLQSVVDDCMIWRCANPIVDAEMTHIRCGLGHRRRACRGLIVCARRCEWGRSQSVQFARLDHGVRHRTLLTCPGTLLSEIDPISLVKGIVDLQRDSPDNVLHCGLEREARPPRDHRRGLATMLVRLTPSGAVSQPIAIKGTAAPPSGREHVGDVPAGSSEAGSSRLEKKR